MFNYHIDKKRISDFSSLGDGELNYHFHITNTHFGITQAKSKEVCKVSYHMLQQCKQEKHNDIEATNSAFKDALQDVLGKLGGTGASETNTMLEEIN